MPRRRPLDSSRPTTAPPDLLTVAETAAVLRCGLTFVYESIHRHLATGDPDEVPGRKVGRSLRVPRVWLERYIGAAITWPIVDHPIVDHGQSNAEVDDVSPPNRARQPAIRVAPRPAVRQLLDSSRTDSPPGANR